MALSIAVAGKGGTGKTTFCALLVRSLVEGGVRPVLAVDADPNSNLAEALGVKSDGALADIREKGASAEGSPSSGVGRVRAIDDEIQRAVAESDGFDVVTMGRPEGPRCYCYVNGLLRRSLDGLARGYAAVVIDNEAGMEHLSRRTTNNIDVLIGVMNPTEPSLRAVRRIVDLSEQLPVKIARRAVLVTRSKPQQKAVVVEAGLRELKESHDVIHLTELPQDDDVERAGAEGESVFTVAPQAPAYVAAKAVAKELKTLSESTE